MSGPFPEDEFSYDGWLVFNGLFSVNAKDGDQSPEELIDGLNQYVKPEPGEQAKGFARGNLDQTLGTAGDVTWSLQRFSERLYPFEYKRTRWESQSGIDDDGNSQTIQQQKQDGIDIYWETEENLMIFRGRKAWLAQNRKRLRGGLSEKVELEELNFDYDFFLWVLFRTFNGKGLTSELSIREISTVGTTSKSIDNTGQGVRVEDSKNVLRSVPAIIALLDQKKPKELECKFVLDNQVVKAKIEYGGKVHVKVTDNELEGLSDLRRMGASLQFIFELLHQYEVWCDLPPTQKYPPEDFFYDLAERAKEEGYTLNGQLKKVPEEYRRKREGQMVDDNGPQQTGQDAI